MADEQVTNEPSVSTISEVLASRTAQTAPSEDPIPPTPAAPAAVPEVPPEPLAPAIAASAEPAPPKSPETGLLKATQAERRKRQELEQQNLLLQQQLAQYQQPAYQPVYQEPGQPDPVKQVESKFENRLLGMSEFYARQAHPDFQEKFDDFFAAASASPALYDSVMNSDNPAEAAYQAGIQLQFQKKYGTDLMSQIKGIRTEVESELRAKIRSELETEYTAKIAAKNNQPTNILQGRAAMGGDIDQPAIGFRDLLARRKR